ncbi:PREDICTED: pseudouridine-metabolizing bifunctional protein C1861.05-like [Branchiostoma belcheri]|uniref:Pseudouridine-metabolizing bifunctional protein C1861.05-like n=1 Tax=Branchiostoma belcheri TaxID=7741 RepID=A0A6P4ZN81_BRABE|nr:PREDICTED: pseudouridine-metabolizing bifunctional protein C1861.05-like [Branchiostoma belcheri]
MFRHLRFLQTCRHGTWQPVTRRFSDLIKVLPEVRNALANGEPVVALESTVITHGMPHPHNIRTAQRVVQIVREHRATPATIAIINGKLRIGLTEDELEWLASTENPVLKTSRRDLSMVVSKGWSGGTTVAATMIAAYKAGISVFVTGGIGGVHRGGHSSLDVSADLTELGRTPIAVVSAGVKSILDIGRTLEYLETQGVSVLTYGHTTDFPAFFTQKSGFHSPYNITTPEEAAEVIDNHFSLGLDSGLLIAVPIPEQHSAQKVEDAIQRAVEQAREEGVRGDKVTPYILGKVDKLTQGKSLAANIALMENNAAVGSQLAWALSHRRRKHYHNLPTSNLQAKTPQADVLIKSNKPVVVGASVVDFVAKTKDPEVKLGGMTNPGTLTQSFGGVGRNVADCMSQLGAMPNTGSKLSVLPQLKAQGRGKYADFQCVLVSDCMSQLGAMPLLVSAVGNDPHAASFYIYSTHMDVSGVSQLEDQRTATYCAVLNGDGELVLGVGDMDINNRISPDLVSKFASAIELAPFVCVDGNIPEETVRYILKLCHYLQVPAWYEPTCVVKSSKPFESDAWKNITYLSPNLTELRMIYRMVTGHEEPVVPEEDPTLSQRLQEAVFLVRPLLEYLHCVVVTLSRDGVLVCRNTEQQSSFPVGKGNNTVKKTMLTAVHYPVFPKTEQQVVNVSGAGDCFSAGMMHGMLQGLPPDVCVKQGLLAAYNSTQTHSAVPASLDCADFSEENIKKLHWPTYSIPI